MNIKIIIKIIALLFIKQLLIYNNIYTSSKNDLAKLAHECAPYWRISYNGLHSRYAWIGPDRNSPWRCLHPMKKCGVELASCAFPLPHPCLNALLGDVTNWALKEYLLSWNSISLQLLRRAIPAYIINILINIFWILSLYYH